MSVDLVKNAISVRDAILRLVDTDIYTHLTDEGISELNELCDTDGTVLGQVVRAQASKVRPLSRRRVG